MLCLLLALTLITLGGCPTHLCAADAEAVITKHDASLGTYTYREALDHLQYNGGLPDQWSVKTTRSEYRGTIESLTYKKVSANNWRATVVYTFAPADRLFANGFN